MSGYEVARAHSARGIAPRRVADRRPSLRPPPFELTGDGALDVVVTQYRVNLVSLLLNGEE